jgi:prophage DNA circulation protein
MTEKTEFVFNTGQIIDQANGTHDVILNRLNSWHENGGRKRFYDAEEFRKVTPEVKESPHIFAKTHPLNIGKIPLEDALKEVDARIIGTPQDVLVTNTNLLRENIPVADPEVDLLMKEGKIHVSTAFTAFVDEEGRYYNIKPNHVLFYPVDTGIAPGDPASLILNQSEKNGQDTMAEDTTKNEQLDLLRELITNQAAKDELQVKLSEQSEMIFNQKSEIEGLKSTVTQKDETITNQATAIETLNGKVAELSKQISDIKTFEKNKRRERIFNQYAPGIRKAFETRKDEIFDDTKYEDLIFEMNQAQVGLKQPPTEASGTEDVQNQGDQKPKFLNGVIFKFSPDGKPIVEEA